MATVHVAFSYFDKTPFVPKVTKFIFYNIIKHVLRKKKRTKKNRQNFRQNFFFQKKHMKNNIQCKKNSQKVNLTQKEPLKVTRTKKTYKS
jgi:hypothetical protein